MEPKWVVYHSAGAGFIKTWNFAQGEVPIIRVSSIEEKASESNTKEFTGTTELLEETEDGE